MFFDFLIQEVEIEVEDGSEQQEVDEESEQQEEGDEEENLSSSNNEQTPLDQWWWLEGANAPQHVTSVAERACLLNNARTYRCRTTCFGTGAEARLRAHATTVRSRRFQGRDARIDRSDVLPQDDEDAHRQMRFAECYTIPGCPRPISVTTKAQKLFLDDQCANLPPDLRNHTFQNRGFSYHGLGQAVVKDALAAISRFDKHGRLNARGAIRKPASVGEPNGLPPSGWPRSSLSMVLTLRSVYGRRGEPPRGI